ncbi:MAG TPA: YfiR family protein [Rickettsiales bacterium]|nr:YfiR family protein [Rickettsiales bacterium]
MLVWPLAAASAAGDSSDSISQNYPVKAALIYNFSKFVTWPSAAPDPTLCVSGDAAFEHYMEGTRHPNITLVSPANDDAISGCSILYISDSDEARTSALLNHTRHHPVLTVSPEPGFADHGGIIELATMQNTIGLFSRQQSRLRINISNAQESGLVIDARLLQIAEVIKNK